MKQKGFEKPVKYLIIGKPNLTKTTMLKRIGLKTFETDRLDPYDLFDIKKYDLTAEAIIIGGKWFHQADTLKTWLIPYLTDYKVIMIKFKELN